MKPLSRAARAMFMQPPAIISQMTSYQSRFKPTLEGASKPYFLPPPHLTCFLHLIIERIGKVSSSVPDTFLFDKAGRGSAGQKLTAAPWTKKVYKRSDKDIVGMRSPAV